MRMIELTKEEIRLNIEALKIDKMIFNEKADAKVEMLWKVEKWVNSIEQEVNQELDKLIDSHQHLSNEIDRLAEFIINNVKGEPSKSQGAIDTAIRLLSERQYSDIKEGKGRE